MRIRAFHIDAFGLYRDVAVEALPPGLAIFLGRNEAGKSTLLDFFRSTLAGYPARSRHPRDRAYVTENRSGGSLELETVQGQVRLTRRPGVMGGEPSLVDGQGLPLDSSVWERLMGGVSRDVYTSVYGFSLRELQEFSTLSSDEVRNALYGASFGMGVRSPGRVLRQLETDMEKLFKPAGSKQPVSLLLKEWEDTRRRLRQCEEEAARYDELAAERDRLAALQTAERQERVDLETERRRLERRLGVWQQWEEWRLAGVRLDRLATVPASFPQDGPGRLERGLTHVEGAERALHTAAERLARTRGARERCLVDEALLAAAPALRALGEAKGVCRNALADMPGLDAALTRLLDDTERQLRTLGPDWDTARVRAMNCPLPVREHMGRVADALQRAEAERDMAGQVRVRAEADVRAAHEQFCAAKVAHEALPVPAAELDETHRARLRDGLQRVEEAARRLPEREQALSRVRGEFGRALGHLHLRPRHLTAEALGALSEAQEASMALAGEALDLEGVATEARRQAERARDADEQARDRLIRIRRQKADLGDPDRLTLEARRSGLRSLRNVLATLPVEESRLQEAEDRLAAHLADAPDEGRHPLLAVFGGLLAVVGGAGIAALKVWGITSVTLTPELTVPLVLWHGYLVLLAGLAFVAAGLPRKRPEILRHATMAEQLRQRVQSAETKLGELLDERDRLCEITELADLYPDALDALEAELDRERDQCAAGDRLDQEMATHEDEAATLHQRAQILETEFVRRNTEAQQARRRWHEHLMELGVQSVPAPDGAAAFFARVDSARAVWSQVEALEHEVAEMQSRAGHLAALARQLLPEAAWPVFWNQPEAVLEAVRAVLESCRLADLAAEERRRAAEAVRAAEARYEHDETALAAAEAALVAAMDRLEIATTAWGEALETIGLPAGLSPATAQEALRCADRVLALDAERARLTDTLHLRQRERDAFVEPLRSLLGELARLPASRLTDEGCLSLYDQVLADAEAACRSAAEGERLDRVLEEEEAEWRAAQAVHAEARQGVDRLLRQAEAADPEDFLRRHTLKLEREALSRRREDLEDALRLAADGVPFDAFVEAFARLEKDELEARVETVTGRLAVLAESDERTTDALRTLGLRLEQLAAADTLTTLRLREAALVESLQQVSREWARLALAHSLVGRAKRRFEEERQPDVIRIASALFATITGGRWTAISASLEDSSLWVLPPYGEPVSPEVLSRGTQEQLYLALRLAHIRNHAAHSAPLPVIMDDILVNFDPERAARTAQALADLTRPGEGPQGRSTPGHQVFFFTCHPHTADMLASLTPGSTLYRVENGAIAQ